jgi:hypothetical protein
VSIPRNVENTEEEELIEATEELEQEKRGLKDIEAEIKELVDEIRKERRKQKIREIVKEQEKSTEELE